MGHREPPEVILVTGQLTHDNNQRISSQVDRALRRLSQQSTPQELILVIDSLGGKVDKVFCDMVHTLRSTDVPTAARIYCAASAAAMLALSAKRREIDSSGSFCIHDGSLPLSPGLITSEGLVSPLLVKALHEMRNLNRDLLTQSGVKLTEDMAQNLGIYGELELNPSQCLEVGVVSRIV